MWDVGAIVRLVLTPRLPMPSKRALTHIHSCHSQSLSPAMRLHSVAGVSSFEVARMCIADEKTSMYMKTQTQTQSLNVVERPEKSLVSPKLEYACRCCVRLVHITIALTNDNHAHSKPYGYHSISISYHRFAWYRIASHRIAHAIIMYLLAFNSSFCCCIRNAYGTLQDIRMWECGNVEWKST